MGYALAAAARESGAEVTLISGPVCLAAPAGVKLVKVTSAQEMYEAVAQCLPEMDAAVFAAAVADYRPVQISADKIKKQSDRMTLELERTPDILGSVRSVWRWQGLLVGFAAETTDVLGHAREKLIRKGCDILIANDVSRADAGFDTDNNAVTILHADGTEQPLPLMPKLDVARQIVRLCLERLSSTLPDAGDMSGTAP